MGRKGKRAMKMRWLFGAMGCALMITAMAFAQESATTPPGQEAAKKVAPGTKPVRSSDANPGT